MESNLEKFHKIADFLEHHPISVLGPHYMQGETAITAYIPEGTSVSVEKNNVVKPMQMIERGVYTLSLPGEFPASDYFLLYTDQSGYTHKIHDPYGFGTTISDYDIYLYKAGTLRYSWKTLGAHLEERNSIHGVVFRVWAPNAKAVSVVGNFNHWIVGMNPMENVRDSGIWEIFIPDIGENEVYKYAIKSNADNLVRLKIDPYAFGSELRPRTASVVKDISYEWHDSDWYSFRETDMDKPIAIYEVHLGSWKRKNGEFMNYVEIGEELVKYLKETGFNFVEFLPLMEHPLDASWGYQVTDYYSPTRRFGSAKDLKTMIETLHNNRIGVILDWVPAHFPSDDFGLSLYDGTHLYEHEDPRKGYHPDWKTMIFNLGRNEVKNYLLSNAFYWIDEYHADGIRIDAVSSMLYLDYSRKPGEWVPNIYGGRENLDSISFFKEINSAVHQEFPGTLMIAEESTAWPGVTRSTESGGLGFDLKWNMGWMHDTLHYFSLDPVYRKFHQNELTFSMWYAFNEKFLLPLSHDEVVYGKGSLYSKMPGDYWQKMANLRLLLAYLYTFPGKKLIFMGGEFGQEQEWDYNSELNWGILSDRNRTALRVLIKDLNSFYRNQMSMYQGDTTSSGFEWIDFSDADQSVISFMRIANDRKDFVVCILNFTPVPRNNYRIGVPESGFYSELLNTDSAIYGGTDSGNLGGLNSDDIPCHGKSYSLSLYLPPLAALILKKKR